MEHHPAIILEILLTDITFSGVLNSWQTRVAGLDLGTTILPIDHLDPVFYNISYTVSKIFLFFYVCPAKVLPKWGVALAHAVPSLLVFASLADMNATDFVGVWLGEGESQTTRLYPPACSSTTTLLADSVFSVQGQELWLPN